MAKQVGPLFITGTIDGVIFYKLDGQYYMRSKGDYKSGKQMRKDPRLKRTMQKADQFGGASKIVKGVYYMYLPPEVRKLGLFGNLTGMVNGWLQQGKSREEAEEALIAHCQQLVPSTTETAAPATSVASAQMTVAKSSSSMPLIEKPVQTPKHCVKQARYLSHWKVKRNGRLYIPKLAACLPTVMHNACHTKLVSGADDTPENSLSPLMPPPLVMPGETKHLRE